MLFTVMFFGFSVTIPNIFGRSVVKKFENRCIRLCVIGIRYTVRLTLLYTRIYYIVEERVEVNFDRGLTES